MSCRGLPPRQGTKEKETKIYEIMKTLSKGSRGDEVKTLQSKLNLLADGIFGSLTEEAVKEFQRANGLTVDGIVGAKTWERLGVTNPRNITKIIVHCSATPEGEDFTVDDIRKWHLDRGFSDIGYHYVIYRDGTIAKGRDEKIAGAHCTGQNTCSIGICYIGGNIPREEDPKNWSSKPKDTRTEAQNQSLLKLLKELKGRYPQAVVYGHRDFESKACPSFDAKKEYSNL